MTTKLSQSDLKFYPSERLTDSDDGGGLALGTPIKGVANELFNPISSIARVNGGLYARLAYAGVQRADDEPLIGSFLAITKPPADPSVSYLIFKAHKFGESRLDGIKRIESFSVASIESKMTLLSVQPTGSKIVQAYQRVGESLPLVGDVYCLRQDKKGYPQIEQYIQVVKVESETRTFYNPKTNKDFERVVVKLQISQSLTGDFLGAEYPSEEYIDTPCKIRETSVVDAGAYYGVKPITTAIKAGIQTITVPSLTEKLVPTNQVETHLVDLSIGGSNSTLIGADGKLRLKHYNHHHTGRITTIYTGNAITVGSVSLAVSSQSPIIDRPTGNNAGTLYLDDKAVGVVDYATGLLQITSADIIYNIGDLSFSPAGKLSNVSDSLFIPVSLNNRSYSYVFNLPLTVASGSLTVKYRSNGRFYTLTDDGTGALKGASAGFGSGAFNVKTGSVTLSLGELPDVGSGVLLTWASTATTFDRKNETPRAVMILPLKQSADPSSIRLSWNSGGEKSATVSAQGVITGDWVGRYNADKHRLEIATDVFDHPQGALDVTISYNKGDKTHQSHKAPLRGDNGTVSLNLTGEGQSTGAITPNSVKVRFNLLIEDYDHIIKGSAYTRFVDPYKVLTDDGQGRLIDETGKDFGTVDYINKRLTFLPDTTVKIPKATYAKTKIGEVVLGERKETPTQPLPGLTISTNNARTEQTVQDIFKVAFTGYEYINAGASMPIDESALVEVWFYDETPSTKVTESVKSGTLEIDVLPTFAEQILLGSLNMSFAGKTFYDNNGLLMCDLNQATGQATVAGQVDYQNGVVSIKAGVVSTSGYYKNGNSWVVSGYVPPSLNSLISAIDIAPIASTAFITPSSPIRPQSLQIRATTIGGKLIRGTSNARGEITGDGITGTVDYEYGVVSLRFGKWVAVTDEIRQAEGFDDAQIKDGKVWQEMPVLGESVLYNAVSYSYLPVDSTTIKIDTVRLPQDGRVPIFRRGDTILIANSQSQTLDTALTGGQVITLNRQNVARICLKDSLDKAVNATLWDYDLVKGTISFNSNLNLSGYQLPLIATTTIEERNRILTADIDGTLSLIFPTKYAYPTDNTYVSSVLIGGDLQVKASVPFTQRNWDNVWRDEPNGAELLNRLNVKNYPIQLTDDGAISERWLIKWTSSSQFELYGETLGFVKRSDTLTDLAPINPATQKPYFTLPKQAFGADAPWSAQDVIRFNTKGTLIPFWVLCAVQPSSKAFDGEDGFKLCLFGDTSEG